MRSGLPLGLSLLLLGIPAHAEPTNRLALELSGTRVGPVLAKAADRQLDVTVSEVTAPVVALASSFTQGRALKRDIRLSTGALVRKTNEAHLASIKYPAMGYGGGADVELVFAASPLTTSPLLSAKEAPPLPAGQRITDFRIDVPGLDTSEAPKLEAITITQKADGTATTGPITFETKAGGGRTFMAWQKSKGAARSLHIEYVGAKGAAIMKLDSERCLPTTVLPLGESGTTRVTLTCGSIRAS